MYKILLVSMLVFGCAMQAEGSAPQDNSTTEQGSYLPPPNKQDNSGLNCRPELSFVDGGFVYNGVQACQLPQKELPDPPENKNMMPDPINIDLAKHNSLNK